MNWVDVVIIVLGVVLGLLGWKVGIIRAAVFLGGTVAGIVLAGQFYSVLAGALAGIISTPNAAKVAAFLIIMLVAMLVATILGRIVRLFLRLVLLGWLDGVAGAVVGVAMAALISAAMANALSSFSVAGLDRAVEGSSLSTFLLKNTGMVLAILPQEFRRARELLP